MKPMSLYGMTQEVIKVTHKQMYSFLVLSGWTHMNRLTHTEGEKENNITSTLSSLLCFTYLTKTFKIQKPTSLFSPKHLPSYQKGSVKRVSSLWINTVSSCTLIWEELWCICTCAFCATSSTSWNFSDTVRSSFGGSCINQSSCKFIRRNSFLLRNRKWKVILPWVQKPQAQCSTGSSNLWKIGRKYCCC